MVGLNRAHLVGIDIVEDRLSFARILNKTLHRISDKGVGEHVCDVEKVLGDNVGGAAEVKICQLICLRTILNEMLKIAIYLLGHLKGGLVDRHME